MKKAYSKDIWRSIQGGKKRFFSLMLITVLGVAMMCGLKASCVDLRKSADSFFDSQGLFDIAIMSTLGLTDEDVSVMSEMEGIQEAEGAYSETVYTINHEKRQSAVVKTLSRKGINMPYILEGRLPENTEEIAVTEKFVKDTGKAIGDTLEIEEENNATEEGEEEKPNFPNTVYRITAVVTDAADVNNPNGAVAFRSTASSDYTFFVLPEAVESDVYTVIYLVLSGGKELFSYSSEYERKVYQQVQNIESRIKEEREQQRYQSVLSEAYEKLEEAQQEMNTKIADAEEQLAKAEKELEDGKEQLKSGEQELIRQEQTAKEEFAIAWQEIGQGYRDLELAEEQLQQSKQELVQGESQLAQAKNELEQKQNETFSQLSAGRTQLENTQNELTSSREQAVMASMQPGISQEEATEWKAQIAKIDAGLLELSEQFTELEQKQAEAETQFAAAWQEIAGQESQLENGKIQFEAGLLELENSRMQLETGVAELTAKEEEVKQQIADGKQQLEENRKKLEEGTQELLSGKQELEEERAKAEEKLQEARRKVSQIDMAQWYVQDRSSLSGYSNIESDASCIEAIGTAFPALFLIVAILISLTTVTRMVEEERGLIGTYKALGFTDGEILKKYVIYASAACFLGGIVGDIGGFVVLPEILFIIFRTMYLLPEYYLQFDFLYGIGGILLFMAGITGATVLACRAVLRQRPAVLMRPKAPRLGSRVILERLPFLWNHFSFLNKVTARNLFRYKKRLFMTVAGIMGCTALLVCGFAIKDTVTDLMPKQYEQIYQYDLMAVASTDDNEKLLSYMTEDNVLNYLNVQIESVKVKNAQGEEQNIQMLVVPQGASLEGYIHLKDAKGKTLSLNDDGIFITQNAADVLSFGKGETVFMQNLQLVQKEAVVEELVQNYLGNTVYLTQKVYESFFGEYQPNGVLIHLSEQCADQRGFADELGKKEGVLSSVSTQELKQDFSKAFTLINMVVYIVIFMAAGLAIVVLFTLSTTNISERERELATIKVLGFYDREVHLYVNKETLILTVIGILFGLPLGSLFGSYITYVLKMPSIYFAVSIHAVSFLIAAAIAFCFALAVDGITNRTLDNIDPVDALKSVE